MSVHPTCHHNWADPNVNCPMCESQKLLDDLQSENADLNAKLEATERALQYSKLAVGELKGYLAADKAKLAQVEESNVKLAELVEEKNTALTEQGLDCTDEAIGTFQDEVRALVLKMTGAPDNAIDGKGSDAGWQEFTLAEIAQGLAFLIDKLATVEATAQRRLGLLRKCEWVSLGFCIFCHRRNSEGHKPDCQLAAELAGDRQPH